MLFQVHSVVFILACLDQSRTVKATESNSSEPDCNIQILIMGNNRPSEYTLSVINKTVHDCQSMVMEFAYQTIHPNDAGEESLADLNQIIYPLLAPVTAFADVEITVIEAKGLSVDFKIPNFNTSNAISLTILYSFFGLFYNNGSEVRNFSTRRPDPSPLNNERPLVVALSGGMQYRINTCLLIFNRAFLTQISLYDLFDSTVKFNILTFEPTTRNLNSSIRSLKLSGYGLRFDSRIFPLAAFGETQAVSLTGMTYSFEKNILEFSMLTQIVLAISSLRRFFHNNPHWLNRVNQRATKTVLRIELQEPEENEESHPVPGGANNFKWIEHNGADAFDDYSFCIFYQIEQHSLNVELDGKLIEARAAQGCSCLLFWLLTYVKIVNISCNNQINLSRQCDFEKMAQRCSVEKIEPLNYRTIYETILDLEFLKYLADVWLMPVTSLLGIFANFMVIRTFRKIKRSPEYRRSKLTDKSRFMWEYTYYNSWFILLHGIIIACTPLTTCIELNGIYCSPFIMTDFFRLYYLFVEKLLGNTFRLTANMSSTLFVLYRFGLNTDKLVEFRKLKPNLVAAGLFLLSILISVITLFVNEKFTVFNLSGIRISYHLFNDIDFLNSGLFLKSAYLLNSFLVTTLFTFLNICIDLRLMFLIRSKNTDRPKEEAENRITKMVILNGLFAFLFRLPELISSSLFLIFTLDHNFFPVCMWLDSHFYSVCPMLFSISHFLLTISYSENLVLLYLFNENFRKHFDWTIRIALAGQQTKQ
nr:G protein-coupled receptor [Proales similis]